MWPALDWCVGLPHLSSRGPGPHPAFVVEGAGASCDLWFYEMTESTLNAEHRRALTMLATAGLDGATQSLLSAHGFGASFVVGLVDRGLVTIMYERVRADGTTIEVKVRIADEGHRAIEG